MINLEKDFADFVSLCNKHMVQYIVIGGYAVSVHGYPRSTKDLDICIKSDRQNADKMISVLQEFGFGTLNIIAEDFMKKDFIMQLGYPPLRIDILNELNGMDFDEVYKNRRVVQLDSLSVNFIGYNELIMLKKMAGRPQDIADVKKLEKRNKLK
jgi:predicted nucleotidyltransferase